MVNWPGPTSPTARSKVESGDLVGQPLVTGSNLSALFCYFTNELVIGIFYEITNREAYLMK